MSPILLLLGGRPEGAAPNPFTAFAPIFLILLIFYFFLIRPQQKRMQEHQRFVDSLKSGDKVVTESGLFGTVMSVSEDSVVLKVAENVKLRFLKMKVYGPQPLSASSEPKKKKRK